MSKLSQFKIKFAILPISKTIPATIKAMPVLNNFMDVVALVIAFINFANFIACNAAPIAPIIVTTAAPLSPIHFSHSGTSLFICDKSKLGFGVELPDVELSLTTFISSNPASVLLNFSACVFAFFKLLFAFSNIFLPVHAFII